MWDYEDKKIKENGDVDEYDALANH
jgi:hypothetical protein